MIFYIFTYISVWVVSQEWGKVKGCGIQFDLLKFVGFQAISYSNLYEKTKLEEQEVRREIYKGIKRGKLWSILQESTAEFLSC